VRKQDRFVEEKLKKFFFKTQEKSFGKLSFDMELELKKLT